jgi:hypothetical protein
MCDFLSGVIHRKNGEIRFYDGLSHSALFTALRLSEKMWAEWEWTQDDRGASLSVRTHETLPGLNESELSAAILSKFSSRADAVAEFVRTLNPAVTTLYLSSATISTPLTIPNSVTTLYLSYATISTPLTIPNSVTTLDLSYATISTPLTIPNSVTTLDLRSATISTPLTIPNSVTTLDLSSVVGSRKHVKIPAGCVVTG